MKSTGEVMGLALDFPTAFAKSQLAAGLRLPLKGKVFLSVKDEDKPAAMELGKRLVDMGFTLVATGGTHAALQKAGIASEHVLKVKEGRPHIVDKLVDGEIAIVINTTFGKQEIADSFSIRRSALNHNLPYFTTVQAARMAVAAIEALRQAPLQARSLQEYLAADKASALGTEQR